MVLGLVNIFVIAEYSWNSKAFTVWLLVSVLRVTKRYVVIAGKGIAPKNITVSASERGV